MPTDSRPTRTRRPESRRQELLDAALRLYLERGVSDSTVADVTEAAGAAKGTFYRYFPSKDHLLLALREQFTDELLLTLEAKLHAVAAEGKWAQLETLCRSLLEYAQEKVRVHDVLFHAPGGFSVPEGEDDPFETRVVQWLADFIKAGVDSGAFDVDDPELTALLFFSALHGPTERAVHAGSVDPERLTRGMLDMLSRTLGRSRSRSRFRRAPLVTR